MGEFKSRVAAPRFFGYSRKGARTISQTVDATFDGEVFRPAQAIPLEPDTQVQLIVTVKSTDKANTSSFLRVARSLKLSGPADWSARLDDYLYGEPASGDSR